ncbi:type II secretion system protein [Candidatus Desantisbacteria bacterium]|nr:type II secretion system protein [Candidatus Desantisbacteria bacterium]
MRKGFTLIELMIVVALVMLIIPIIYSVFAYGMLTYKAGAAQIEIFRSGQSTILLLQNDIRAAIRVADEFNGLKTSNTCIILEKKDNYVYYYKNKNILIRKVVTKEGEQKEMQRLSQCLKNITFEYDKKPLITFNLYFLQKIRGKKAKLSLTSAVKMRNWIIGGKDAIEG